MKKGTFYSFIFAFILLSGCATGQTIARLQEGMNRKDVESILGRPDGFKRYGSFEHLSYSNRLSTGWAWDRADYNVILKDGLVSEYGQGEVRVKEGPTTTTVFLVPVR